MQALAEVLLLPRKVAIIKCKGHDESGTMVARGNQAADEAAKKAAGYVAGNMLMMSDTGRPSLEDLSIEQAEASAEERSVWKARGDYQTPDKVWRGPEGKPILPQK